MEKINYKTELLGRDLWVDGISVVNPVDLEIVLLSGIPLESLAVSELTDEVRRLNRLTDTKLLIKTELHAEFPPKWDIPPEYQSLDIVQYVTALAIKNDSLYEKRLERVVYELLLFEAHGMFDILRLVVYIVAELRKSGTVWGTGRGSSCSSYVLFLIGLHTVDPVLYDIDIRDFIR